MRKSWPTGGLLRQKKKKKNLNWQIIQQKIGRKDDCKTRLVMAAETKLKLRTTIPYTLKETTKKVAETCRGAEIRAGQLRNKRSRSKAL